MARKVTDTSTKIADSSYLLSQTPKNYNEDNFYIKELQQKVDAEWHYRPNRVDLEYETNWHREQAETQVYAPLEVVMQTVKSDKGTAISDDYRKLVFRNIRENRFLIGSKFRFAPDYSVDATEEEKNTWLTINLDTTDFTSSVVINRCNGTLVSLWQDEQNVSQRHEEPVIQGADLRSVSTFYNETAVSPQSELLVIAQYNAFTSQYKLNQRFFIGPDRVYRIKAINKFYANSTNNSKDVGLMRLYFELTEISEYDNFETRVAYQMNQEVVMDETPDSGDYRIVITQPEVIPNSLTSEILHFRAMAYQSQTQLNIPVTVACVLKNLPSGVDPSRYYTLTTLSDNYFDLSRNKIYPNGNIVVTCNVSASDSPSGTAFSTSFELRMDNLI